MFRTQYLDYAELTAQLSAWAHGLPGLRVRVQRWATSAEGRDDPAADHWPQPAAGQGPAVWIDGNMHAVEVCGTSVALAIAEDVIRYLRWQGRGRRQAACRRHMAARHSQHALLRRAAHLARRGRGDPQDRALPALQPGQRSRRPSAVAPALGGVSDVDGDGTHDLPCAKQDPLRGGGRAARRRRPAAATRPCMVPRLPEDTGPFYKLYPEGHIANFDGQRIPDPLLSWADNLYDFNRNFSRTTGSPSPSRPAPATTPAARPRPAR
jgi:hypothetical protein